MKINVPLELNFRDDSISHAVQGNHAFLIGCSPQLTGWISSEFNKRGTSSFAPTSRSSTLLTQARQLQRAAVSFRCSFEKGRCLQRSLCRDVDFSGAGRTSTNTRRNQGIRPTERRLHQVKLPLRTIPASRSRAIAHRITLRYDCIKRCGFLNIDVQYMFKNCKAEAVNDGS